MHQLSWTSSKK